MIHLPAPTKQKPLYHFSVDDVFDSLIEASDSRNSLFDQWFFKYLRSLNKNFGTVVDLYLFFQKEIDGKLRTLVDIDSRLKEEFQNNSWLRFGPHALDYETPPYAQKVSDVQKAYELIYKEIERIAGRDHFSKYARLHFYSEIYELSAYFAEKGVKALFSTDKEVVSYRLPDEKKKELKENGHVEYEGIHFIRTMYRTEYLVDDNVPVNVLNKQFDKYIDEKKLIVFYAHESELKREPVQVLTTELIEYLNSKRAISFNHI